MSVINANGTILAPTFGGGANSLVTEFLGDDAIISSDFGGNPPYEKMREVMRICLKHWLKQSNVLFVIGGKANNTDIFVTFRAMADALREYFSEHGPTPVYVVIGRGGPNLSRGLLCLQGRVRRAGHALPHLRLRFGDDRRGALRPGGRPLDEERRARNARRQAGAQRLTPAACDTVRGGFASPSCGEATRRNNARHIEAAEERRRELQ